MPTTNTPRPEGWGLGLTHNPQPIVGCPNCGGTGRDDVFASPCDCQSWVARQGTTSLDRRLIGEVGYQADERIQRRGDGTGTGTRAPQGATEPQIRYLLKLIAERYASGVEGDEANATLARIEAASDHPMSKRTASEYIDALMAMPRRAAAPQVAERAPVRSNRYAGRCGTCRNEVAAEAGRIERNAAGKFIVFHLDGECPEATTVAPAATPTVAEGNYAIASTGDNDLAFYRVEHGTGSWAGTTFVRLVVGGHPDRNVRREHVAGILARIAADPDAAPRYGREIGRCWMCNRHLTDADSRRLGIGPDCRNK